MAAILQTIFSEAFSGMKRFCIFIKISFKFVPKGLINNNPVGLDNGLVPNRQQAIIWTNADPIHWHISRVSCQKGPTCHAYAWQIGPFWQDTIDICSTRGDELNQHCMKAGHEVDNPLMWFIS